MKINKIYRVVFFPLTLTGRSSKVNITNQIIPTNMRVETLRYGFLRGPVIILISYVH